MTQSFDELFAPKAMTLDELFAAIRPPPLLPVQYPPSDNSVDPWASIASAANMPQPVLPDRSWAGMQSAPFNGTNNSSGLGYPKVSNAGQASIPNDNLLFHILARQSAGADYSASAQTLSPNPLLDGAQPAPRDAVNYSSGLDYPAADRRASTMGWAPSSDDGLLLHILARPPTGLRPLVGYSTPAQALSQDRLWGGVQAAPLDQLNVTPEYPVDQTQQLPGPSIPRPQTIAAPGLSQSANAGSAAGSRSVDYNGQTVRNPNVRNELAKLRTAMDAAGYPGVDLVVTGGESYYDPASNQVISLSDGKPIAQRDSLSAHNIENGARDIDLRRVPIPPAEFTRIIRNNTNFDRVTNMYSDGHWHIGLPQRFSCPSGVCIR